MSGLTTYEFAGGIATVTMDDGRLNVMSLAMLAELNEALDRAEAHRAVLILRGRDDIFSAGFDLRTLSAGGPEAAEVLVTGFKLAERMLGFPRPTLVVAAGHAVAMGLFLALSGDYRIGVAGEYRLTANEVAIGLTMPRAAIEILRARLTPSAFQRAVLLSEVFGPSNAVAAGVIDEVVPQSDLAASTAARAAAMAALDPEAHARTKQRLRRDALSSVRAAIEADAEVFMALAR